MTKKLDPEDFYTTEEGFIVFTEHHHLKRGHCCESGCKHCPYGFDKATGTYKKRKKNDFSAISKNDTRGDPVCASKCTKTE